MMVNKDSEIQGSTVKNYQLIIGHPSFASLHFLCVPTLEHGNEKTLPFLCTLKLFK